MNEEELGGCCPTVLIMGDIQQQAQMAGLFDGSLSSCQAELQELMRQIDIMVNSKRLEWEASLHSAEARLRQREEEVTTVKMALDVKTAEANRLTHELGGMERSQKELVSQYEQQLDQLRQEMNDLRKRYEKLERHHGKQSDGVEKAKEEMEAKLRKARVDLRMAQSKIEDHGAESREWDQQRRAFKHQVEGLEVQRQKLVGKCHNLQQDCTAYRHQLGKLQQVTDQTELDFRTRIVHAEGQLQRAQDTLDGRNSAVQRLEEALEEAGQRARAAEGESGALLEDMGRKEHRIHVLEEEVSSLQQELQTKEGALHIAQKELKQEITKFESILASRESTLRSSEDESRLRSMQASEETSRLRSQLQDSQRRMRDLVESEARLKMEVSRLENRLDTVQGDNAALNVELTKRLEELRQLDNQARQQQTTEKQKSQASEGIEHRLQGELAGMRQEIESLTRGLAQRNAMVDTLGSQLTNAEHRMAEEVEERGRMASELQIANAELDALRVENRSLRNHQRTLQPIPIVSTVSATNREIADGRSRSLDLGSRQDKTLLAPTSQNHEMNVQVLQSQLHAIQHQFKLAHTLEHSQPDITNGTARKGTGRYPMGQTEHSIRFGPKTSQSPGRTRTRTSADQPTRNGMQGSPVRPARPGSVSLENSPVKSRADPRPSKESNGTITVTNDASPVRRVPEGTGRWNESPVDMDSEGLHSLETGSIGSGSYDSPLPSPPAFNSSLGDGVGMEDADVSSVDITGLSDRGMPPDEMSINRPPSRESVGTRFVREDKQHQAELERILSAHIHDLEQKTTDTLAKHSQRLQQGNRLET